MILKEKIQNYNTAFSKIKWEKIKT
jgi:hypothetical protein